MTKIYFTPCDYKVICHLKEINCKNIEKFVQDFYLKMSLNEECVGSDINNIKKLLKSRWDFNIVFEVN